MIVIWKLWCARNEMSLTLKECVSYDDCESIHSILIFISARKKAPAIRSNAFLVATIFKFYHGSICFSKNENERGRERESNWKIKPGIKIHTFAFNIKLLLPALPGIAFIWSYTLMVFPRRNELHFTLKCDVSLTIVFAWFLLGKIYRISPWHLPSAHILMLI